MQRTYQKFSVTNTDVFKKRLFCWAEKFNVVCFLDSQQYSSPYHSFDCIAAVGAKTFFEGGEHLLSALRGFDNDNKDWIFGHFNYDVKSKIEPLSSSNTDTTGFPDCFLFVPDVLVQLNGDSCTIGHFTTNAQQIFNDIASTDLPAANKVSIQFTNRMQQADYLQKLGRLKDHLHKGDCYEINFCQEFFASAFIDAANVYLQMMEMFPNPFSAFYKLNEHHVLCASPERYIKRTGDQIISQPIKGTAPRSPDAVTDRNNLKTLLESEKERRENIIVVDLVRNDLSKVCRQGTVQVSELCGPYSFPQVHQMISTVTGELRRNVDFPEILQATFPMGSMTGAPKKRVMELIEQYEITKRGIYSGTIGYLTPTKDFDFNVVIRSFVYNHKTGYISYHAGSGITSLSNPQAEYDECITKASAITKLFSG